MVDRFVYGTYGELLSTPTKQVRFLYNGSYGVTTDSNGLYYMRARYYNPDIKRFINQDIKVGDISNGQGLNRYAYCEGNPVSLIDPFGLSPEQSGEQTEESKYQWLHTALDVVGIFWDGADIINAAVYAAEGDWKNAALCAMTAIPVIGGAIYGIAKGAKAVIQAKKAAKIASLAQDSLRMTKKAADSLDTFTDTMKVLTKHGPDAVKGGSKIADTAGSGFALALKSGDNIGEVATKASKQMDTLVSPAGVKVTTTADDAADALKVGKESGSKTKDIYRAVGVDEYYDIIDTGRFRGVEGTFEAKEFGNSFEETLNFANQSINKDKVAIIKVTIPEKIYNQLHHMELDIYIFTSGTPVVEPDMLDVFNKNIISIEHVY